MYQTQRKEGPPHLHRVPGVTPGALPWPHGEHPCEEGRVRLPPGLRTLSGTLQNALQANLAPLERTCQVMRSVYPESAAKCCAAQGWREGGWKRFCHWTVAKTLWENTSVDTEECAQVSLTKALNPRMNPGEWLCPALISCSGSGQLPGVLVWMWSRLSEGKEKHFKQTNKLLKPQRMELDFTSLCCMGTDILSSDRKEHSLKYACKTPVTSQG